MEDVKRRFAEYKRHRQQQQQQERSELLTDATEEDTRPQGETQAGRDTDESPDNGSREPATTSQTDDTREPENLPALPSPPPPTPLYFTLLKILLWGLLWGFFIEVGFGAVFFITSILYMLVASLRGSRRKPWEPSAYSVFNRNFEAIDGTLSAEQFERELRYGPMNVKR